MPNGRGNLITRMLGKGTLQQKILKTILICVLIPMGVLAAVAIIQISPLTATIGSQGSTSISDEGLGSLKTSAADAGRWVMNEVDQARFDLQRLVKTWFSIYNGSMNVTEMRPSYHQNLTPSVPTPVSSPKHGGVNILPNNSDWVNGVAMTTPMKDTVNRSAYLDYIMKAICGSNANYLTITFAFRDTISRVYPYIQDGRSDTADLTLASWFAPANASAAGSMLSGYSHVTTTYGNYPAIYFTMPIKNATHSLGVVAIEYRLTALRTYLNAIHIQSSGYIALIDNSQVALSHPGIGASVASASLASLEVGASGSNLSTAIGLAIASSSSTPAFTKSGNVWRVAGYQVVAGIFYTISFVPYNEIVASGTELQATLATLNGVAIGVFIGVAAAIFVILYFLIIKVSRSITRPIVTLTAAIENMTKGDLTKEIPLDAKGRGDELGTLAMSFQNLLTTMRLGNKSYYRGDISLAYTNYKAALELFETTGNLRGQAMSHNNLGNIYRQWTDYDKAKESYEKAIKIGESQTDHAGLAARYNNRGLLLLSEENYDGAKADFERAMLIDKELGDEKGLATRNRNMGVLNSLKQQWKPAQKFLDEALKIDSDLGNDAGIADDEFQLGRLAQATNDMEGAEKHYKKAVKLAEGLRNLPLVKNCLEQLIKVYDSLDSTTNVHKTEAELARINETLVKPKEVVFVMDQSGSMQAEGKMTASRSGALEVFEETINVGDEVAVIGFHSIINPLLPLTPKKGTDIAKIKNALGNLDSTPYQTAFYDAVAFAIEMLKSAKADVQRWIVALTDGQDNMSKQYNPATLAKLIKSISPPLNFILIGVGSELKMVHNEMTQIVEATPRGKYIKIYSPKNVKKAIEDAFKRVKEILAASEIEGFTPE